MYYHSLLPTVRPLVSFWQRSRLFLFPFFHQRFTDDCGFLHSCRGGHTLIRTISIRCILYTRGRHPNRRLLRSLQRKTEFVQDLVCGSPAFKLTWWIPSWRNDKSSSRFNKLLVACALILALAFIIVSAVQHNTAVANCEALFSTQTASTNTTGPSSNVTSSSGICNVWTWVQLGIMGLLFIIITLSEVSLSSRLPLFHIR